MRIFPIVPIWLMSIICFGMILFLMKKWKRKKHIPIILEFLMVIFIFIINLRIMIPSKKGLVVSNNLDILIVVDKSISMMANDYGEKRSRLDGMKEICHYLIESFSGSRFSIISFDSTSKIDIPFSKDTSMALEAIDIIQPKAEWYATGSTLNAPKEDMLTTLKSSKEKNDRIRIVFFISDGEITKTSEKLSSYEDLNNYIDNGAVLGFGSKEGATMYVGEKGLWGNYILSNEYETLNQRAISKMDENNLQKMANDMGIDYIPIKKESDLYNKVEEIQKLASSNLENSDKSSYEDTYFLFLIPLILLLLLRFKDYKGVYR